MTTTNEPTRQSPPVLVGRRERLPSFRTESLRTTLWLVPTVLVVLAVALFLVTYEVDRGATDGGISLPGWLNHGGPDAARAILTAIAAAVITVVGVVFSITIVALTLASTQFGPRMLRNFIRDVGTQVTLGVFVATFVFCVLALGSVSSAPAVDFVPHISVTVALALTLVDLGVLIYFIHHVAKSIQITEVIGGIARDLGRALQTVAYEANEARMGDQAAVLRAVSLDEVQRRLDEAGAEIAAATSGYLQAIDHLRLVRIAAKHGAVIRIAHRPGHFVVKGRPLAIVWPAGAAPGIDRAMQRAHAVGPSRTLAQDLQFAIDQLVEIAIRALSPAVNDTYTAVTCIDWLGDAMCKLVSSGLPDGIYRDGRGQIRLVEQALTYDRVINRAFDKIRQAGRGMPAVMIRQLENLAKVAEYATTDDQRRIVSRQAAMVMRSADESVAEPHDVEAVADAYDLVA
ncbi:MAG TPA: DUF2254 domain-containing protein, partial [Acidimicrobiales bacterium]